MSYKESLLMPVTSFEMRGNLTKKEPVLVEKWNEEKLYEKMNANREGCEEFLLHDGPPYANGDIHCGHMLNRLLKDFIVRYKNMRGYKTPFVFGWDTHGLPIETKVTKSGVNRKAMSVPAFRDLCRDYALKQVAHQKEQIRRLGCLGDYDAPYLTLNPEFEAREVDVFAAMALQGIIYKGLKPVYWSPSSESALAEAEVEYQDVLAKTLYIAFPVIDGKGVIPSDARIVIWTTTPWTIPSNRGITLNPRFEYGVYDTDKGKLVFLCALKDKLVEELGLSKCELIKTFKGSEVEGGLAKHPLYERESLLMNAAFVDDSAGTGCVHTDPDHGLDDFNVCSKYGIKPFATVDDKGIMHLDEDDPCTGKFYDDCNDIVIEELEKVGALLKEVDITHSYPHDWRTHKPVIYRATPQWFCSIAPIKDKLLEEVHKIKWEPAWGEQKMVNMIVDRTDWCISRQRAWGVPLPIIYNEDGSPIIEKEVFDHIRDIIAKGGSNAWFSLSAKELLPEGYTNEKSPNGEFTKETDIMDVWFDSGSSWNGVLNERGLSYPADLYLEGNDQYRGWFNSSLILSCAYSGHTPFKSCLTHGWVMDENWNKMSKSAGNGIDPSKVANEFGADILRLWAASINYEADVRLSESIVKTISEQYRKIRNTFKFMLGNLQDGADKLYVKPDSKPNLHPLDIWTLARLEEVKNDCLKAYDEYAFASVSGILGNFMVELSTFYLDFAKDALYCLEADNERRKAIQYVIYELTMTLCLLYNPILPFTMDEVYKAIPGHKQDSPQLDDMPTSSSEYLSSLSDYDSFTKLRDAALKALESKRNEGLIASNMEAAISVKMPKSALFDTLKALEEEEVSEMFGVSQTEIEEADATSIEVKRAEGERCERCRRIEKDTKHYDDGCLCGRCARVIGK